MSSDSARLDGGSMTSWDGKSPNGSQEQSKKPAAAYSVVVIQPAQMEQGQSPKRKKNPVLELAYERKYALGLASMGALFSYLMGFFT